MEFYCHDCQKVAKEWVSQTDYMNENIRWPSWGGDFIEVTDGKKEFVLKNKSNWFIMKLELYLKFWCY